MSQHTVKACEVCDVVHTRCRCPGPHPKVRDGVCIACAAKRHKPAALVALVDKEAATLPPPAPTQYDMLEIRIVAPSPTRLVILESPYAGDVERNVRYARAALRDSLQRGEAPLASHLLYTQPGVLDDNVPAERTLGIEAGLAWVQHAAATVVYVDLGISKGMRQGIARAEAFGRTVQLRGLHPDDPFWR